MKLGTINPCALATIRDKAGRGLATCLDTPNALAYAFSRHDNAVEAIAYYPGFAPDIKTRQGIGVERIAAGGWLDEQGANYKAIH